MKIMNSCENSNIHELIFCHHCPCGNKNELKKIINMFLTLSCNPLYWIINCS